MEKRLKIKQRYNIVYTQNQKIEDYKRLLDGLKIFGLGWSWGEYKSLAAIADTKHRHFKGKKLTTQS